MSFFILYFAIHCTCRLELLFNFFGACVPVSTALLKRSRYLIDVLLDQAEEQSPGFYLKCERLVDQYNLSSLTLRMLK